MGRADKREGTESSIRSCEARLRRLFGPDLSAAKLRSATGVLQVAAVVRAERARLRVIRLGVGAPASVNDLFSLAAARARADAVLTSGQILRDEPSMDHRFPELFAAELSEWRHLQLGREVPPWSVVLTSGTDLWLGHPLFSGPGRVVVMTSEQGAVRLAPRVRSREIEIVARARPGARDSIEWLRDHCGLPTVLVELGPSSSRPLYSPGRGPGMALIDELLLSVYEGELSAGVAGGVLATESELRGALGAPGPVGEVVEESGRWSFRRYRRRAE